MIPKFIQDKVYLIWLIAFSSIGFMTSKVSSIAILVGIGGFLYAVYLIASTRNNTGTAHIAAAFFLGTEVYFRMSGSGLPWEFSKYAISALLVFGMILDNRKRSSSLPFLLYFFLLMPALFLTFDYFNDIELIKKRFFFNMFGAIILTIASIYFYKYKMNRKEFLTLSRWIVLGTIMMGVLVYFNVGDYSQIKFGHGSNADASGGFSGNQVSIAFGIGIMIILVNMVMRNRLFYFIWIDTLILFVFVFQALMTFSRGGLIGGVLSALLGAFVFYFSNFQQAIDFLKKNFIKVILAVAFLSGTFMYVNEETGGFLYARYFNVDDSGYQIKEDATTGRGDIAKGDLMLFEGSDYLGVGIGVSPYERVYHKTYAPHIEFTRMLAEHGVLGLMSLFLLLLIPLRHFLEILGKPTRQLIFVASMVFALSTMTHAAMRVGAIGFFYGLAFIVLKEDENEK